MIFWTTCRQILVSQQDFYADGLSIVRTGKPDPAPLVPTYAVAVPLLAKSLTGQSGIHVRLSAAKRPYGTLALNTRFFNLSKGVKLEYIAPYRRPFVFIPLHTKSDYSLGYGAASIEDLVARTAALDYTALALNDLENLSGQSPSMPRPWNKSHYGSRTPARLWRARLVAAWVREVAD